MMWTKESPAKEGWYWHQWYGIETTTKLVYVFQHEGAWFSCSDMSCRDAWLPSSYERHLWAGPISAPEQP